MSEDMNRVEHLSQWLPHLNLLKVYRYRKRRSLSNDAEPILTVNVGDQHL